MTQIFVGKNNLPINEDKQVNEVKGKEKQIMNKTESIISRTLSPPPPPNYNGIFSKQGWRIDKLLSFKV